MNSASDLAEYVDTRRDLREGKLDLLYLSPERLMADDMVELLRELRPLTGGGRYVFPSLRTDKKPMSDNTLNAALRRLGYESAQIQMHGLRHTASTMLNEMGFNPDLIELQLAHKDRDKIRAIYNHAQRLPERRA
ncbi:integrase, partial [bacterium]|nr:integrase [bacterium]